MKPNGISSNPAHRPRTRAWIDPKMPAVIVQLDGAYWMVEGIDGPWVRIWLDATIDWSDFKECETHATSVYERELRQFIAGL